MATWKELRGSPRLEVSSKNPRATANWIVVGIHDSEEMDEEVRANTPSTLLGMSRLDYSASPQGGGVWFIDVSYGISPDGSTLGDDVLSNQTFPTTPDPFPGVGDPTSMTPDPSAPSQQDTTEAIGPEFSFDSTGGTTHITQSLETISRTGIAPDCKGAIGFSVDSVEGTDIIARKLDFSYTAKFKFISVAYILYLADMTGTVNADNFFGCAAGTLLFKGASGNYSGGQWTITFQFSRQPNLANITIGALTVPAKKGWEYLWVAYEPDMTGVAPAIIPRGAYVERVYQNANFVSLGI